MHGDVDGVWLAGPDAVVGAADVLPRLLPGHPGQPKQGLASHDVTRASSIPEHACCRFGVCGAGQIHCVTLDVGVCGRRHRDQRRICKRGHVTIFVFERHLLDLHWIWSRAVAIRACCRAGWAASQVTSRPWSERTTLRTSLETVTPVSGSISSSAPSLADPPTLQRRAGGGFPPSDLHSSVTPSPATATKDAPSPTAKESFAKWTEVGGAENIIHE